MPMLTEGLKDSQVLHTPALSSFARDGISFVMDGEAPNWAATDPRGERILRWIDGRRTLGEVRRLYACAYGLDEGPAWRDLHCFLREALRRGLVSLDPVRRAPYPGRAELIAPKRLSEFWLHVTQACNIACTHCLVSSSPKGERGPEKAFCIDVIDQAHELGARRFYMTGGEPFAREDVFDLITHVVEEKGSELIVMTNAMLLEGSRLERLKAFPRERLKLQVSLDGAGASVNDAIRGKGVFDKASAGLKAAADAGFAVSLTAAVTRANIADLRGLPDLARRLGARSIHLMWLHKRGRVLETGGERAFPSTPELLALTRAVKRRADELGVALDNADSMKTRADSRPSVKYDLGNPCWESLCLYVDGRVYPSAAMAGVPELSLGDARKTPLKSIWLDGPVAQSFRRATVADKPELRDDPFRHLTGGGDIEHSFFFSSNGKAGSLTAEDPYYELYVELLKDAMAELAAGGRSRLNARSGSNPPVLFHSMGEGAVTCSEDAAAWLADGETPPVRLLHSNCVLAFDVEKPYRIVQGFYGKAAVEPRKELCCPVKYAEEEVGHIPQAVLERFYGCGSPVSSARIRPGETVLDLGSGAGIDCFIAAKKVGREGRVVGVDMTAQMLGVARGCQKEVSRALGYDVVEFKEGYLEKVPVPDKSVDLVTSNCVINLSPDKSKVFSEMWRILKDCGRMVVADIVSDRPVPLSLQAHKDLWGECISGSLSEEEFLAGLEKAGFYGLTLLKKTVWKEVEGVPFYSVTVQGFKFEKKDGCRFIGQKAVYSGPYKAVLDEEGHLFARGEAVEVCTDTAAKLRSGAYAGHFAVLEPGAVVPAAAGEESCLAPGGGCC